MGRRKPKLGRRKPKSRRRKRKTKKEIPTAVGPPPLPPSPPPPWIELPRDITANILQRLGTVEILESAQKVCATWRRVCQDPAMWRVIDMKRSGYTSKKIANICRLAVDWSQGQLIDLSLNYSGDNELLNYIVQRSSHLRRLTLNRCYQLTGDGLAEAVTRLPHLEELHLVITPPLQAANIEAIGISCPMLKSFTCNERRCVYRHSPSLAHDGSLKVQNINALAIAKTMPNLSHLRIFEDCMENEGLQAILDGCPHLESLDIRQCLDLDLGGDLGKRCEQIKNLRRPSDSISDIESVVSTDYDFSDFYDPFSDYDPFGWDDDFEYYDSDSDSDDYTDEYYGDDFLPWGQ